MSEPVAITKNDTIAAVTYVSSYAMSKLLRPEIYGYPVQPEEVRRG